LLTDLRDLAAGSPQSSVFQTKVAELVKKYERRKSLVARLRALQQTE